MTTTFLFNPYDRTLNLSDKDQLSLYLNACKGLDDEVKFDGDVENVLESLQALKTKVIKPKQLETEEERIKFTIKMMGLICIGTATQTFHEAAQAARKYIYEEYLEWLEELPDRKAP